MSAEIRILLAQAAPTPAYPLDVGSIMRRGNSLRTRRMMAVILAVPVLVTGVWTGIQIDFERTTGTGVSSSDGPCERAAHTSVFLKNKATQAQVSALAREIVELPHVIDVTLVSRDQAYVAFTEFYRDKPEFWSQHVENAPARLDVSIDDWLNVDVVEASIPRSPAVYMIPGELTQGGCRRRRLEEKYALLERAARQARRALAHAKRSSTKDAVKDLLARVELETRLHALRLELRHAEQKLDQQASD